MSYSTQDKLKSTFLKPVLKAAVSGVATRMIYGDKAVVAFGQSFSTLTFGAGMGLASEGVAQIINMWVLPRLESNNKARHFESLIVSIGISAGSFALLPMLISADAPTSSEMATNAGVGALAEVVTGYLWDNLYGMSEGQTPLISIY
jgi:hypothetical protein